MDKDGKTDGGGREKGKRTAKAQMPESDAVRARAEERKARLARTLRDNLARRKQQARARRSGDADETEGLPAAKSDESQS